MTIDRKEVISDMQAEEYLMQVRMLNRKINNRISECERLRALAEGTSVAMTGDRVQSSPKPDKMSSAICKLVDMQKEIDAEIDRFVDLKKEVISVIEQVDNPHVYDVLYMYYVQEINWTDISKQLNYTYVWIHELKNRGFEQVQQILNKQI